MKKDNLIERQEKLKPFYRQLIIGTVLFFLISILGKKFWIDDSWLESIIGAAVTSVVWYVLMRVIFSKLIN